MLARHLKAFQAAVSELGTETYPNLLRLGRVTDVHLQPIAAKGLLVELELAISQLADARIPGIRYLDAEGVELGRSYRDGPEEPIARTDDAALFATPDGLRILVRQFPPPVGFRSRPALKAGSYECYFAAIAAGPEGWAGTRTAAMGGGGAPVPLPALDLPPVTRWDIARTAGRPTVARLETVSAPAVEVYRDTHHTLTAACTESLRLKAPLLIREA